jgi:predicted Fe-Mo cluster-binding NifX family protein
MQIAIPNCQGRVSPVFDVAARLLVIRLKNRVELERREIMIFQKEPNEIVHSLEELGIGLLICGGISQGLEVALQHAGIRVLPQICGEIDAVIAAYRAGTLNHPQYVMPGCCGQACVSHRPRYRRTLRSSTRDR